METALVHKPSGAIALIFRDGPKEGEYEIVPVIEPTLAPDEREIGRPTHHYNRTDNTVHKCLRVVKDTATPAEKFDRLLRYVGVSRSEFKAMLDAVEVVQHSAADDVPTPGNTSERDALSA